MKDKSLNAETYTVSICVNVDRSELDKTEEQLERITELVQLNSNAIIKNATMTATNINKHNERLSEVIRGIVQDEIHKWVMRESQPGGRLSRW
ncbi:hypothetical protein [Photorhabdus namnaonensis]|uniref:Uncharacterized protein n=1 Tax=Photorhabdus namnaonensis TaxID=1851568 RepID=A0A1B8YJ51_9GAMM|nr:hypothetical protein [Photorhabdus namnaonensis]OCA55151.1 hypothetical protein Phpb_01769 [Photorhabdus namnaonensis]